MRTLKCIFVMFKNYNKPHYFRNIIFMHMFIVLKFLTASQKQRFKHSSVEARRWRNRLGRFSSTRLALDPIQTPTKWVDPESSDPLSSSHVRLEHSAASLMTSHVNNSLKVLDSMHGTVRWRELNVTLYDLPLSIVNHNSRIRAHTPAV